MIAFPELQCSGGSGNCMHVHECYNKLAISQFENQTCSFKSPSAVGDKAAGSFPFHPCCSPEQIREADVDRIEGAMVIRY